ncbi:MAG: hypothetical protein OMM_03054 [Candidatus Magnetoglobus multicellularis str. Araruama]|uniref:NHL repeat containing protein n=1 Tax=Candidatus Magnetoglobus multicellularis str. Araruama TaxID=890399 RepID=A0A1V1P7C9_9BACT|nr:MAG: hypothetical protein OMM_03054 [Candidatus Magnetoglobus multicellularis str. Araruama]
MLLVSDSANDRIVSFMLDGNPLADHETIIEKLPSKLNYPAGIASGKKGQIYIADATNNRIVSIQIEPEIAVSQWSSQGTQKGSFIRPNGICVIDDHVLVSNGTSTIPQNYHWVQRFSKQGVYLDRWPQYTISDNILASSNSLHSNQLSTVADSTAMLYRPSAIAQDDHFYYILDSGNHRLIQMNHDHTISKIWGQKGTMPGEMDTPRGLALFHDLVVIADTGNDRIVVFDNAGNYQLDFGEYGADEGQFLMPKDIDIDMDGIIYVADTGNNRIQRFSIDGHFLGQWGEWGNQNGQMNAPSGIAVHPDNTKIVVADTGNHRCQVFDKQGRYITKFGEHGSGAGQFNEPYHLDIDLDHNIYVTDRINNRVQKFQPITLNDDIVKGIIVVGDDTYGDALFQTNANLAYRALNYQGMGKNDIFYMSKDTDLDLDDNGLADDIDSLATNNNLQNAVTDWADDAQHVIIFLIGHNDLFFRMNASEILDNAHLDEWMDQLQTKSNCRITFIFDACKSGNYIQTYSAPEGYSRVIITSTGIDENAYLMGAISFSNYFWTHIFNGNTVQTAFIQAAQTTGQINQPPFMAMPQNPLMDANNNGIANETQDYSLTQQLYLGNAGNDQPETLKILSIASPITLTQGTSSVLWAQVESDTNEIQRVWSIIRPPDYQAGVSDTIETELIQIDNNHYQSVFQNFEISGTYLIAYYAMDDSGKVSMPEFSTVSVNTPMARRAVIIVGETFDLTLDAYLETVAANIYDALIFQGYTDETLYVMSPRIITNGWDGMVNANNIQYALNQWTQTDDGVNATQDIVICFLGKTLDNAFIVNYGESISSDHLNTQLTYLENQMPGKIVVICDMPNGLGFLSQSAQSGSERRVHISGSSENERAVFIVENNISFSTFFWQRVLNGFDIKSAFTATTDALNILNHYQSPCLEANGDGNVNEYEDYVNAREFTIGYGIMQAQDTVSIASVMPQKELSGESQSIIWVKHVTSTSTIDAVWAVIVPPGIYETDNMIIDNLPQTELKYNESTNRYEGRYDTFNVFGTYRIAIYARSANGMTSVPVETRLHQTGCPDSYELNQDNTIEQAAVINVNASDAQYHNFHNNQDIDWVKFYALEGTMYRIFTTNADLNCDTILSLYDQNQKMIIQKNSGIGDENEVIHWSCPGDGIYYVSVQNYKTDATNGLNTGYELRINLTATIFDGHINGYVRIQGTETPIANALIRTSKNLSDISLPFGTYRISGHESGEAMIFAQATGFLPYASTINVLSLSMTRHDIYMTPQIPSGDLNLDGFIRLDDAIIAGKILTNIDLSDQTWFVSDRLGVADMVYILNACAGFY